METPTRLCTCCEVEKTVRGIWYLVPLPGGDAPSFWCESCFNSSRATRERPAPFRSR